MISPLAMPLALTDFQLKTIMTAARPLQPDRRAIFLERVGAMLNVRRRFDDRDVAEISKLVPQPPVQ
jgi:hypothetical protein